MNDTIELREPISSRVHKARMEMGLDLAELSTLTGISAGWWDDRRQGRFPPRRKAIDQLCSALCLSTAWFKTGDGEEPDWAKVRARARDLLDRPLGKASPSSPASAPAPALRELYCCDIVLEHQWKRAMQTRRLPESMNIRVVQLPIVGQTYFISSTVTRRSLPALIEIVELVREFPYEDNRSYIVVVKSAVAKGNPERQS